MAERWPDALRRFTREFERVNGCFYHVAELHEAAALVGRIAREREARRVVTWSGMGLEAGLSAEGLDVTAEASGPVSEAERARFRQEVPRADIGVTGADLVVAETGSLVLISGAGKARSISLLPPYHVAMFGKEALVESLEQVGVILEAIHRGPERSVSGASISFVTGPSRTADIELTLTRGVHGPKEVHAIFVESL